MIQLQTSLQDLNIETFPTVTKKYVYADNNNNATIGRKKLYSLFEITGSEKLKNFYIEIYKNSYKNDYYLYEDYGFIANHIGYIPEETIIEKIINLIETYKYIGYEGLKLSIQDKEINNQFISIMDIKILELGGENQELINHYIQYRNNFYAKREAEEQEKARIRKQKEQEKIKIKQLETEKLIADAEQQILNGEKVFNKDIEVLNKNNELLGTSLLLYLFKHNNINIPLKTQGWINKALYSIFTGEDNIYTYNYYNSSKNSTVFQKYLLELIETIKNKNNVALSTEEIETKQAEQEKQEYINNIKDINFKKESNIFRFEMDINILKKKNGYYDFNLQEQETLVKRIFKALKYEHIESKLKDYLLLESLSNREFKNRITLSKNNINISVIGIKDNDKIKLYFKKYYDNKDDVYISIETL